MSEPAAKAVSPSTGVPSPSWFARIGMALVSPREALRTASDRRSAGRSGSDLLVLLLALLAATQLRWIVQAFWIGGAVEPALGLHALVQVLTSTLSLDLGALLVAALAIAIGGKLARDLGRAFDLACVAVVPVVAVDLIAGVAVALAQAVPPDSVRVAVMIAAHAWAVALVVLAILVARHPAPVRDVPGAAHAGWILTVVAACGAAVQLVWLVQHADLVRPLSKGAQAPAFALASIGPGGALGPRVSAAPGRITVVDFWATWCGPCLRALPGLDQFARAHPDVDVIAVNLDDPAAARALFDQAHYSLRLVLDDGQASERYGVSTIPHTVVIAPDGTLAAVSHGDPAELEPEVARLGH